MITFLHLSHKKYAYQSLKKIYGLNNHTIFKFISILGLKPKSLSVNLTNKFIINRINELFFILKIDFRLKLIIFSRIILLIYNKTYKGIRHIQGLPCRGQRTHANSKTPKYLKLTGKNLPFKIKRKVMLDLKKPSKKYMKQKKKIKLSKKQKGKLKAKQKLLKKKKKK